MIKIRLYTPQYLEEGSVCLLEKQSAKHLVKVLRARPGDQCFLFNGNGHQYLATVLDTSNSPSLKVTAQSSPNNESPLRITLAQGVSRGDRMDFVIQKSVECGVHQIDPIITSRCGVKLNQERWQKRQQHWQSIAISACEQSGRCVVPQVAMPISFEQWLEKSHGTVLIADTLSTAQSLCSSKREDFSMSVIIGSEGGFTDEELALAYDKGCQGLSLGPRILRTETAAVVAITSMQLQWGDMPMIQKCV